MLITTQTGATFEIDHNRFRRVDTGEAWGQCRLISAAVGQPARLMVPVADEPAWGYRVTTPVVSVTA